MDNPVQSKTVTGDTGQQVDVSTGSQSSLRDLVPESQSSLRDDGSQGSPQTIPDSQGSPRDEGNSQSGKELPWKVKIYKKKKAKGSAVQSQSPTSVSDASLSDPNIVTQTPKPPTKPEVKKDSRPYLWNAGGRKKRLPSDIIPPKQIVIDKVPIYIKMLY